MILSGKKKRKRRKHPKEAQEKIKTHNVHETDDERKYVFLILF